MYDYIIVGAGTAGCIVAARLSESADCNVLLIEAGGRDDRPEIHTPSAFPRLYHSEVDWDYYTDPQSELHNRRLYWPRGRMLGGCSSMNAMIYIRGDRRVFDSWSADGNQSWAFEDLLPYFRRSEHQQRGSDRFHGVDGSLSVIDPVDPNPMSEAFVEAAVQEGWQRSPDFNAQRQSGFGLFQVTQLESRRASASSAFLHPALERPNLSVRTNAQVEGLMFAGQRVIGVRYREKGQLVETHVQREVILCGGAINTPQLLMLSGIGPADHLRELGIEVRADLLAVGSNLQDHLAVSVAWHCKQPVSLRNIVTREARQQYKRSGTGPMTSNIAEAGGFVCTKPISDIADLQFLFAPCWYLQHGAIDPGGHGFTIVPTLLTPRSRGEIRLRSADPAAAPVIQPMYLTDAKDLAVLMQGVRWARDLAKASAMAGFRGEEYEVSREVRSDDQWADYIRRSAETLYHPVGTCRMGNGAGSVVDHRLRVHGVENLRVMDASIMPTIINGNTNAATMAIAERGVDLVRAS